MFVGIPPRDAQERFPINTLPEKQNFRTMKNFAVTVLSILLVSVYFFSCTPCLVDANSKNMDEYSSAQSSGIWFGPRLGKKKRDDFENNKVDGYSSIFDLPEIFPRKYEEIRKTIPYFTPHLRQDFKDED